MRVEALNGNEYQELVRKLERYCKRFQERDKDGASPTFRQVAARFNIPHDDVEALIYDSPDLDEIVGMRVGGLGGGVFEFEHKGEHQVEYYGD